MACKRSAVRSRLPPPATSECCSTVFCASSLSSRGLGHRPFTAVTGVRIPVGTPEFSGAVVQLVRIPACHAGGRGFESRPLRQKQKSLLCAGFFVSGGCRQYLHPPSDPPAGRGEVGFSALWSPFSNPRNLCAMFMRFSGGKCLEIRMDIAYRYVQISFSSSFALR
jgi:hypothetical protein